MLGPQFRGGVLRSMVARDLHRNDEGRSSVVDGIWLIGLSLDNAKQRQMSRWSGTRMHSPRADENFVAQGFRSADTVKYVLCRSAPLMGGAERVRAADFKRV